jgi:hypothetical protein
MEKLILNQLKKSLEKLKQISIEVENYPHYDPEKLIDILFAIYQFVVSKEKPVNVFTQTLNDFMESETNKNFKLALLNDIHEILDKYEKEGFINYPASLDWKSIHHFREEVETNLMANAGFINFGKEIKSIHDPVKNILFLKKYPMHQTEIAKNIAGYFIQRINAEIVIPFFHYHVKYTWDLKPKPEHNFQKGELENYIQSWIELQTTPEEWLHFQNIDIFKHLEEHDLSDEKLNEIRQHRFQLFCQVVDNVFKNHYKEPFEQLQSAEAHEVAKRDLTLINQLISGNLNEANQMRVAKNFRIKDWQKAVLQIEDLLRNKYASENNYDIYHEDSHLYVTAVLKYKKYLEKHLKNQTSKRKSISKNSTASNNHTILNFGLKPTAKPLITLIKQLSIEVNLLKENLTTPEDLTKVLSANKLTECKENIYFDCQTKQLSYIIDKLKPYFKNFTPTTIEKSGLFFTKKGTPLKAQNLYSNRTDKPQEKTKIDSIFKHF